MSFRRYALLGFAAAIAASLAAAALAGVGTELVLIQAAASAAAFLALAFRSTRDGLAPNLVWQPYIFTAGAASVAAGAASGHGALTSLDIFAVGAVAQLTFGRLGCRYAGCCYGRAGRNGRVPVQLIEASASAVICAAGVLAASGRAGAAAALVILAHSAVRFALEEMRGDAGRRSMFGLTEAQWVAWGSCVAVAPARPSAGALAIAAAVTLAAVGRVASGTRNALAATLLAPAARCRLAEIAASDEPVAPALLPGGRGGGGAPARRPRARIGDDGRRRAHRDDQRRRQAARSLAGRGRASRQGRGRAAAGRRARRPPRVRPLMHERRRPEPCAPAAGERRRVATPGLSNAALSRRLAREAQPSALLVDDAAATVEPHQLKVSAFLDELHKRSAAAARDELGAAAAVADVDGEVARGLAPYRGMGGSALERTIKSQLPEAGEAIAARDLFAPIVAHVRSAARERKPTLADASASLADKAKSGLQTAGDKLASGYDKLKSWGKTLFSARPGADTHAQARTLGAGAPLESGVRARMEPLLGDLSAVTVHQSPEAGAEADRLGARAFAVGTRVAFGAGEYRPGTPAGDALIAHELAHVAQQDEAGAATASTAELEHDADAAAGEAAAVLHGGRPAGRLARRLRSATALARCPKDKPAPTAAPAAAPPQQLEGTTSASYYNIRETPGESGKVLGTLQGLSVPVTVTNKQQIEKATWYRVTLKAPVGPLPPGTSGWVGDQALATVATPWPLFAAQLDQWEAKHAWLDLDKRITLLRQMCHESKLPFDEVIGVPAGATYAENRRSTPGEWDILKDSQQVAMPDGSLVDMYHLLVGLDVLPRKKEDTSITQGPFTRKVGQNYSAATWAGDVGAAVTEGWDRADKTWEAKNDKAGLAQRQQRYFTSRASSADLLGDIDAWGVDDLRGGPDGPTRIVDLLRRYYEPGPGTNGGKPGASPRKKGVERFLKHYGLTTSGGPMRSQPAANAMQEQIRLFAMVWITKRAGLAPDRTPDAAFTNEWLIPLTGMFLDEVEKLAASAGAQVP